MRIKTHGLLLVIIFCGISNLCAQTSEIDSLREVVNNQSGTEKIDALNALAFRQLLVNYKLADESIEQALKLSIKENYIKGQAEANVYKGIYENLKGNKNSALHFLNMGILQAKKAGINGTEGYALTQTGNIYRGTEDYDSAKFWYSKSDEVLKDSLNPRQLSVLYRNQARLYNLTSQPKLEFSYLMRSYAIRKILNDKVLLTDIYVLLSQWYINQSNLNLAKDYLARAERLNISETLTEIRKDINYQKIVILFKESRYSEALEILEDIKKFYLDLDNLQLYARLLLDLADILESMGSYDLSIKNCFEALKICEEKKLSLEAVRAKLLIGKNYMRIGQTSSASELANDALKTAQQNNLKFYEGVAYNLKGLILQREKKYTESLVDFKKGFSIRESIKDKPGMAASLNNIGEIYAEMGDLQTALNFQMQSEAIAVSILSLKNLVWAHLDMGRVYLKQKNFAKAEYYLVKAEILANQIKFQHVLQYVYPARRNLFAAQGKLKEALIYSIRYEHFEDSISTSSITNRVLSLQSIYALGRKNQEIELLSKDKQVQEDQITIQKNKIQRQQFFIIATVLGLIFLSVLVYILYQYFRKKAALNKELQERNEEIQAQSEELSESNTLLVTLNQKLSERQEEIQAQSEELTEANTSLTMLNMELAEKNEKMATQSEELSEANSQFLHLNQELAIKQKELEAQAEELRESYDVISELNESLEQKVEERTREMKQAYKELDTFFYRSSHDFKRPLTTFMGLAEVAKITVKDNIALDLFEKVKETAVNLDRMLIKLQSISDVGAHQFVYKEVSMQQVYESAFDTYHEMIDQFGVHVTINVRPIKSFQSYPAFLKIIVENLVENAIQFRSHNNPNIVLAAQEIEGGVQLTIRDNGQGIQEEYQSRLFEMFFRGSEQSKGNGLGLYIVKKAVEKMKGNFTFKSIYQQGTTITVWFPFQLS